MNISGISSSTSIQTDDAQNARSQRGQAFKALASALQSGDLAGAQSAFASLESKKSDQSAAQQPQSQVGKDFQALSSALSSGDVSAAQKAFATLQQDMKAGGAHGHHHHQGGDASASAPSTPAASTSSSTTGTIIDQLV